MKPEKKDIERWCQALRSCEYKQTKRCLQNKNGMCCLGLAVDLFVDEDNLRLNKLGFIYGSLPLDVHSSPLWLKDLIGDFLNRTNESIARINDRHSFTFNEIADCLEAVYIHEVLG